MKVNRFNFAKAVLDRANNVKTDEFTEKIIAQGEADMKLAGIDFNRKQNSVVFPLRAIVDAGTAPIGQEKRFIFPAVSERLVLVAAGAPFLAGLSENVSIPNNSGYSVLWAGENETVVSDGLGTVSAVDLAPKRLILFVDVSNYLLFKASKNDTLDAWLQNDMMTAVAAKLEKTILSALAKTANSPQGLFYKIGSGIDFLKNAETVSLAKLIQLEADVDDANALNGNSCSYIMSGKAARILRNTPVETGLPQRILANDNLINGYKVFQTNCVTDVAGADEIGRGIVFANWSQLLIAQFGGYDVEVDRITQAKKAITRFIINAFFDAKGLRGSQITDTEHGVTDPYDYAYMSSVMAIK
jgi:HK97 family phage major capsid protein